ncbi:hypothetical protein RRG08_025201 [Elysia crispata]|uniref:DDE-1 domain-containing protein n=1 Tax=Elysia crispata TaxID=231223 RepID=A0AAE1DUY4_9GAST|nr:hypothetical protein RRG08_025201 [Elysia crispata]
MNGTKKLPLLTIGRFEKPRCMKNVKSLPAVWKANRKAWMTSQIFEEWLKKLDRKMLMQGRSIAMIVDNCPAHPSIQGLRAVELIFLPPNTSVLQPCDQGIIQALKARYRKRVLKRLIASIETHDDNKVHLKLTVLDAITMAAAAWDEVTPTTIANCFRHAGFVLNDVNATATTTTHTQTINKDLERSEMEQLFTEEFQLNKPLTTTWPLTVMFQTQERICQQSRLLRQSKKQLKLNQLKMTQKIRRCHPFQPKVL